VTLSRTNGLSTDDVRADGLDVDLLGRRSRVHRDRRIDPLRGQNERVEEDCRREAGGRAGGLPGGSDTARCLPSGGGGRGGTSARSVCVPTRLEQRAHVNARHQAGTDSESALRRWPHPVEVEPQDVGSKRMQRSGRAMRVSPSHHSATRARGSVRRSPEREPYRSRRSRGVAGEEIRSVLTRAWRIPR